jgi:hypothetical protein
VPRVAALPAAAHAGQHASTPRAAEVGRADGSTDVHNDSRTVAAALASDLEQRESGTARCGHLRRDSPPPPADSGGRVSRMELYARRVLRF